MACSIDARRRKVAGMNIRAKRKELRLLLKEYLGGIEKPGMVMLLVVFEMLLFLASATIFNCCNMFCRCGTRRRSVQRL